jgi:hypothetical protein
LHSLSNPKVDNDSHEENNVKKMILLGLIALAFCQTATVAADKPSYTLYSGWSSKYVVPFAGATIYNRPILTTSLSVSHQRLFGLVYLNHSPNGGWNNDAGDDMGYIVSYDTPFPGKKANLTVGYIFFDLPPVGTLGTEFHELFLDLSGTGRVKPYVLVGLDLPTNHGKLDGGVYVKGGVKTSLNMGRQSFDLNAGIGGHDGAYGVPKELVSHLSLRISTEIKLGGGYSLNPDLLLLKRVGRRDGMTADRSVVSIGVAKRW